MTFSLTSERTLVRERIERSVEALVARSAARQGLVAKADGLRSQVVVPERMRRGKRAFHGTPGLLREPVVLELRLSLHPEVAKQLGTSQCCKHDRVRAKRVCHGAWDP